jgi:hypothetical protein
VKVSSPVLRGPGGEIPPGYLPKDGTLKEAVNINLSEPPDKIYASIVYKLNKNVLDDIVAQHPDITFDLGGSGYNLEKTLPDEIENLKPDYSL